MNDDKYRKPFEEILPFIYQNNLSYHLFVKLINKVGKDVFVGQALNISRYSASNIKLEGMDTRNKRITFFRKNKSEIKEWLLQWVNSHPSKDKGYELLSKWGYINLVSGLRPIDIEHFLNLDEFVFDIKRKKRYLDFAESVALIIIQLSANAYKNSFECGLSKT